MKIKNLVDIANTLTIRDIEIKVTKKKSNILVKYQGYKSIKFERLCHLDHEYTEEDLWDLLESIQEEF